MCCGKRICCALTRLFRSFAVFANRGSIYGSDAQRRLGKVDRSPQIQQTTHDKACTRHMRRGPEWKHQLAVSSGRDKSVRGALQATENTAKTILEHLRWPRDNQPTFPDLPKIIRIAECVTEIGRIDRSWFEVVRCQEMIMRCAEDGKAEAAIVEKERAELRQVFGLVAFDTETYPLLVKSWEFNSIWKRFLPSWRRHRISLAALYQGPPPMKAKTLFKDLWRLVNHHQRVRNLQRLESTHFSEALQGQPVHGLDGGIPRSGVVG